MTNVRFLAPDTDAYVDSVLRHRQEFSESTGIDLDVRTIPSDDYFSNDIAKYLTAEQPPDVFMSGPVLLWQHVGAGLVQPLDSFVDTASELFDFDDFFGPLIASNRWTGLFGDPLGHGPLWELPVNCESYNLAYVPATLERYDASVPTTWEDYFSVADHLVGVSHGEVRGFGQRGIQVWHTMYTGYATQFWASGARDFGDDGRCAIASPQGISATSDFIHALRRSGPTDLLDQRWYELALDFCAGKYGMIVDSDHYVAFYEDEAVSALKGQVGYAPPPVGVSGRAESNLWTWSLVMNSRSANQQNAWRFIEWAASKEFLRRSAFEGNMNPTRASVWDHESFRDFASGWGDFYPVARRLLETDARVLITPSASYLPIADRWVRGIRQAYAGERGVAEALEEAAADIDRIVAEQS